MFLWLQNKSLLAALFIFAGVAMGCANVPAPNVPTRCDSNTGIPTSGSITMPSDGFYVVCSGGFNLPGMVSKSAMRTNCWPLLKI